ncbi:disulfide isomerase DsbC N-terminal domain-containing protein [Lysobacter brunescens]|uniref:Thiol:disulfide interchange protein n=1 Tax=Lysobacter brunescens TaxID=262323 RepID=A0ABW2Y6F0_9GAMM
MKYPVFALLCALSLSACAQTAPAGADKAGASAAATKPEGDVEKRIRAALASIAPKAELDRIAPAPIPGFMEVITEGQTVYVSNDGRYMIDGYLFDIAKKENLSELGLSVVRRAELAKIPASDRIVFAPVGPARHRVAIFTDIECGFCRKLHEDIAEYNKRGIAIEYLAFPRSGLRSPDGLAMQSVWCASDRRQALTDAKAGRPVPPMACKNPVADQYESGRRMGLTGTPMIINEDGLMLPGYLPPDKMLESLDKLAAQGKGAQATAGGAAAGAP